MGELRNHTLTNLLLATCAFALGVAAQGFLGGIKPAPTPTDGLLVYLAAALLFVVAIKRTPRPPGLPLSFKPFDIELQVGRLSWSAGLGAVSVFAIVTSLFLFGRDIESGLSWGLYLAAVVLFLAAVSAFAPRKGTSWQRAKDRDDEGRTARWEWIALGLILVIGLFFRLYRFTELPYGLWYDEADNGLSVRRILDGDRYPIYVPSTNLPAHFLYLIALSFRLLGDSMHAIRAVAVVFGMLTVVAAYLCGRELSGRGRGRHFGLILAFLMAVSRWDVNWSRIGMHGVTLPFFELWVVAALLRGLRTGRPTAFAWAGVALGLGLCFYSPFRIFPFIVGGFGLIWFWQWLARTWREHPSWTGRLRLRYVLDTWTLPVVLILLGAFVAVAPVAQFALRRPEVFWDRVRRISAFKDAEVRNRPVSALLQSTGKHLLMFSYRGDPNGRHNLPGAPMLDRLSSVLLVLGALVCLVRLDRPRSVLLLLWLLVPLVGGIISTWFEAPQSLRAIGSLPAVCALACLPLEWLAGEWQRVFPRNRVPRGPLTAAALILLAAIGLENGTVYFYFWAHDFSSWAAFNPGETHMAQDIVRYQDEYDLRFDPLLTAHLATRYLAPEFSAYDPFDPATVYPLTGTSKEGVVLFISPDTLAVREQAKSLYPGVQREAFVHQRGSAVLHTYKFSRETIQSVQGLDARYLPLEDVNAEALTRVDSLVNLAWGETPPLAYPFEINWTGGLLAPSYGVYTLRIEAPGPVHLTLDGRTAIAGTGSQSRQIVLAQGVHRISLDCQVDGASGVRLLWQKPGDVALSVVPPNMLYRASWPVGGLAGRFYPNPSWEGEPALVRIDRQIAYYFHFLPQPRPYTVEWTGRLSTPISGTYSFGVKAISSASLYIDGEPVIEDSERGQLVSGRAQLSAGMHDIEVRFLDDYSHSQVYLYWMLPGGAYERVPPEALFLPLDGAWWPVSDWDDP
jgi:4-amino-4-deoxy-L-arabinose transferase-like glycosyltransferase